MKKISKKEFESLSYDEKLELVTKKPEYILLLSSKQKSIINSKELDKLISTALSIQPALISKFNEFGLNVSVEYAEIAKSNGYKTAMNYVNWELVKKSQIKKIIKEDLSFLSKLPESTMASLKTFINKYLENKILMEPKTYDELPDNIKNTNYVANKALIETDCLKIADVSNRNINNGKLMFKAVKKNADAICYIPNKDLRYSLIKCTLKVDPMQFENLPESYQDDPKIRYQAYRSFVIHGFKDLTKYFDSVEIEKYNASMIKGALATQRAIERRKDKLAEAENEVNTILNK